MWLGVSRGRKLGKLLFDPRVLYDFFELAPGLGVGVQDLAEQVRGQRGDFLGVNRLARDDFLDEGRDIHVLKGIL